MRIIFMFLLLFVCLITNAQFGKYFKKQTLRFDYYHSGNFEDEYVVQDEIILEGRWAGPRKNLIDPFDYGACKIMVYDSASGTLIYSRGFSTLFIEYQSTEEARSQCGNFSESFLIPEPKKTVRVEFYTRRKDMEWENRLESFINPRNPEIKTAPGGTYPVEEMQKTGNPKKKFDLVFLPEGYTEGEMIKFKEDSRRFLDILLETDPYGQFVKKINAYAVLAPSDESGTDIPADSIYRNTLLSSGFSTFNSERYLTTFDFKKVRDVASGIPYDQIVILVNHSNYGGGGFYNFYAITTVDNIHSGFVFTHEFGHMFAGLGDEYSGAGTADEPYYLTDREPWEPNLTTLADFESKWKDLLEPGTPVPTPDSADWKGKVGVFEGAGYMDKGIYRPYIDCSMNVIRYNNFCPVCKNAIIRMMDYFMSREM